VRTILRAACLAAALHSAAAAANDAPPAPRPPADFDWALRLAKDGELVSYRGVVDANDSGLGAGGILYPAPSAAGFIAAVITHGLMVEALKSNQKSKAQEEADKVLAPFQAVLGAYGARDLMREALGHSRAGRNRRAVEAAEAAAGDWLVDSLSVFSLTQDQRAIVVDSVVSLYAPQAPAAPARQMVVRVVSDPRTDGDPAAFWSANLRTESARLFAQALDLGLAEAAAGAAPETRHRTLRYLEGGAEKMERAQLLAEQCGRMVMRTLRGAILSAPASSPAADAPACAEPAAPR
jgi:hypothetical protein